jgi:signal transduction histidine kinase
MRVSDDRRQWRGYALAFLAVAGGLLLRYILSPLLGQQGPYLILTLSIVLAGLYGGFGPAILATALGTMIGTYLFIGTKPGWESVLELPNITRTLLFVAIGISISLISGQLKASRRALAASVLELRRSNRAKDQVLATVAHEIRNPLSALTSAINVLERAGTDPTKVAWATGIVGRQVAQISRLSDDLTEASRVLHGHLDIQSGALDLRFVLRQALEQSSALMVSRKHDLTSEILGEPAMVWGDAARLVQVFANLLNNASKYTPPGGRITLKLSRAGSEWVTSITDSGQGFDKTTEAEMFEPFVQAPAAVGSESSGLGLGLAVVKRIVELHDGQVFAESLGPGQGATFTVLLPFASSESHGSIGNEGPLHS